MKILLIISLLFTVTFTEIGLVFIITNRTDGHLYPMYQMSRKNLTSEISVFAANLDARSRIYDQCV